MSKLSKDLSRAIWTVLAVFILLAGAATQVFASKVDLESIAVEKIQKDPIVQLTLGKGELLDIKGDVSDVLVANPSLIDVHALQSGRIYVVALQVGDTNILVMDAQGNLISRLNVHVRYDVSAIQSLVDDLFPEEDVQVGSLHNQIFIRGTVSTPLAADKVSSVVARYVSGLGVTGGSVDGLITNLLNVRGEQQVMLRVKIVEASRRLLKELGVETNVNSNGTSTLFDSTSPDSFVYDDTAAVARTLSNLGLSEDAALQTRLLTDTGLKGIGLIEVWLNALEERNIVSVLAEPNLVSVSGEQAGFLAGGEFPVPRGRDQQGNIVVEMQKFGVSLNFKPTILSSERISLLMDTEVSSLDYENAVTLSEVTVPGLDVRRVSTTVELASGGSLMIAGLLKSENVEGMSGVPGLSDTPVLGELVKSDSFKRDETELLVIVTPFLVEPYEEKDYAEEIEKEQTAPLSKAFAANIRRIYGNKSPEFKDEDGPFGYMLN